MKHLDSDLALGSQLVRRLINLDSQPPLVHRKYQSLGKLHAELLLMGLRLSQKRSEGPGNGYMLFYARGNVLVRIKTRGSSGKFRGGVPHLTISLLSGSLSETGGLDTSYEAEQGKFHVGGGLVNKHAPSKVHLYSTDLSPRGRSNGEVWSDGTHFDFPDLALDDHDIDNIRPL
jgi:hypothetical protein